MHAEDDFADLLFFDALDEAFKIQLTGADTIERAESAHEDMVDAGVLAGGFELDDVTWFFDDQDRLMIARLIRTDRAWIGVCSVATLIADFQINCKVPNGVGQLDGLILRVFEQVKGDAFSRPPPDSREGGELVDESIQCRTLRGWFGLLGHVRSISEFGRVDFLN